MMPDVVKMSRVFFVCMCRITFFLNSEWKRKRSPEPHERATDKDPRKWTKLLMSVEEKDPTRFSIL